MQNWEKIFNRRGEVDKLNANLAAALAHCPSWEAFGWAFRCVECHIASGSYKPGDGYAWHSHREYQMEIPLAGAFEFISAGGKKILLRPGRALIIPWKFAHRWECLRPGPMLGISLELLPSTKSIGQDGWLIDDVALISFSKLAPNVVEFIRSAIDSAHPAFRSKVIASRLFLLLAGILEPLFPKKDATEGVMDGKVLEVRGREAVGQILKHLEHNLGATVNLSQIAREVGLSGRHLHRLFLKHVGESLHDHLLKMRLDQARRLLMEKGKKTLIKEIAYQCGFNSLAYFSNSFRRTFGVSPTALLSQETTFKSSFTVMSHADPKEAPGPTRKRRGSKTEGIG